MFSAIFSRSRVDELAVASNSVSKVCLFFKDYDYTQYNIVVTAHRMKHIHTEKPWCFFFNHSYRGSVLGLDVGISYVNFDKMKPMRVGIDDRFEICITGHDCFTKSVTIPLWKLVNEKVRLYNSDHYVQHIQKVRAKKITEGNVGEDIVDRVVQILQGESVNVDVKVDTVNHKQIEKKNEGYTFIPIVDFVDIFHFGGSARNISERKLYCDISLHHKEMYNIPMDMMETSNRYIPLVAVEMIRLLSGTLTIWQGKGECDVSAWIDYSSHLYNSGVSIRMGEEVNPLAYDNLSDATYMGPLAIVYLYRKCNSNNAMRKLMRGSTRHIIDEAIRKQHTHILLWFDDGGYLN
jgi:hypothetical protein